METNKLVVVPRYDFSTGISCYLIGAFAENPALMSLWDGEPLYDRQSRTFNEPLESLESAKLIREVVEYYFISRLSIHLVDYFASEAFHGNKIQRYSRQDIPQVLLTNRFLDMFSRPMSDRAIFTGDVQGRGRQRRKAVTERKAKSSGSEGHSVMSYESDEPVADEGEVVLAYGERGAVYERLDLVLPEGSQVKRLEPNGIVIETKKLRIAMFFRFEGFGALLPDGFTEYYLGIDDREYVDHYSTYTLHVDIQVSKKLGAYVSSEVLKYYGWVDSFLDRMEASVDQRAFFDRLGWESAATVLQCLDLAKSGERTEKH